MEGLTVIKVGGNEIDDSEWTARFAAAVAASGAPTVVVHGGGKEVSEVQRMLGAEPEWYEGLRVTTPPALRSVSMVLSGLVNKRLVAALITAGARAVGLSGEDDSILSAVPARGGQLGRTGEIQKVDTALLRLLLREGITPVLSPVSRGADGDALNVNADDAAAAVASALGPERFLLVSNVPGVMEGGETLREVTVVRLESLIATGVASGGMVPKLRAGMRAAASGLADVRIGDLGMIRGPDRGTRILASG